MEPKRHGHTDTPTFPGTDWHVHGPGRPTPPVVEPGTASTQDQPGRPPSDAVVLFDGTRDSYETNWETAAEGGGPPTWICRDGYLEVPPPNPGWIAIRTKRHFGDGQYHVEWASPTEVKSESQGRGNSGVFLTGRYEVQVLDGYDNPTYADGTVGGLYGQIPPLANVCRPPGEWNVYDIAWAGPRFDGERLLSPARLTLLFNGVFVHHAVELLGLTTFKKLPVYKPHPPTGPLLLQDHLNPVRFRNVWYRPLGAYDGGDPRSPVRSAQAQ